MTYAFAPNNLNYINCDRCFYLKYKHKIDYAGGFPQIFNDLDIRQKDYFINKTTSFISNKLPSGKFYKTVTKKERGIRKKNSEAEFKDLEIPGSVKSKELLDNKKRKFVLAGKPDLVVKFKKDWGVLDFKTTGREDKTDKYKHQLEAYAQIFEFPNEETPKLFPISHMGLIQFTPAEIISNEKNSITQIMDMNYYPLNRDVNDFYTYITYLIDILEMNSIPEKSTSCSKCKDAKKYMEVNNEK